MYNGDLPLGDIVWLCVVLISLGAEWTERLDIALPNTISPPDSLPMLTLDTLATLGACARETLTVKGNERILSLRFEVELMIEPKEGQRGWSRCI